MITFDLYSWPQNLFSYLSTWCLYFYFFICSLYPKLVYNLFFYLLFDLSFDLYIWPFIWPSYLTLTFDLTRPWRRRRRASVGQQSYWPWMSGSGRTTAWLRREPRRKRRWRHGGWSVSVPTTPWRSSLEELWDCVCVMNFVWNVGLDHKILHWNELCVLNGREKVYTWFGTLCDMSVMTTRSLFNSNCVFWSKNLDCLNITSLWN